jgi:hypothetical protein
VGLRMGRWGAWALVAAFCGCGGKTVAEGPDAARGIATGDGSGSRGEGNGSSSADTGDAAAGDDCGTVSACGGDIVGTWTIVAACSSGSTSETGCPGLSSHLNSLTGRGTIAFNADMTYSASLDISESLTIVFPAACVPASASCDDLAQSLITSTQAATVSGGCSPSNHGCACSVDLQVRPNDSMGTYSVSGSALTTTPSSTGADISILGDGFCVRGSTLHLISGGDATTPRSEVIATR